MVKYPGAKCRSIYATEEEMNAIREYIRAMRRGKNMTIDEKMNNIMAMLLAYKDHKTMQEISEGLDVIKKYLEKLGERIKRIEAVCFEEEES